LNSENGRISLRRSREASPRLYALERFYAQARTWGTGIDHLCHSRHVLSGIHLGLFRMDTRYKLRV
jgi:hypothetical protein